MNFPDFQKKCSFKQKYNRDSSATDQKSIIFREIDQNTGFGRISLFFRYVTLFERKSSAMYGLIREVRIFNSKGERSMRKINDFCKRNFPDSQKIFRFEPHSDSDSSATDQKSIIFREIHQNTSLGRIFPIFLLCDTFSSKIESSDKIKPRC